MLSQIEIRRLNFGEIALCRQFEKIRVLLVVVCSETWDIKPFGAGVEFEQQTWYLQTIWIGKMKLAKGSKLCGICDTSCF